MCLHRNTVLSQLCIWYQRELRVQSAFENEDKCRVFLLQPMTWGILIPCKNFFGGGFACLGSFLLSGGEKKMSKPESFALNESRLVPLLG